MNAAAPVLMTIRVRNAPNGKVNYICNDFDRR